MSDWVNKCTSNWVKNKQVHGEALLLKRIYLVFSASFAADFHEPGLSLRIVLSRDYSQLLPSRLLLQHHFNINNFKLKKLACTHFLPWPLLDLILCTRLIRKVSSSICFLSESTFWSTDLGVFAEGGSCSELGLVVWLARVEHFLVVLTDHSNLQIQYIFIYIYI